MGGGGQEFGIILMIGIMIKYSALIAIVLIKKL